MLNKVCLKTENNLYLKVDVLLRERVMRAESRMTPLEKYKMKQVVFSYTHQAQRSLKNHIWN